MSDPLALTKPTSATRAATSGCASAWRAAAFRRRITGSGVAAGTHHITQEFASKPGATVSAMVGTSAGPGTRAAVLTASACSAPPRTWPSAPACRRT
jgi:hypothetical protein